MPAVRRSPEPNVSIWIRVLGDAPVGEVGAERARECRWSPYIKIYGPRNLQRIEPRYRQRTRGIEIPPEPILGSRSAIPDLTAAM